MKVCTFTYHEVVDNPDDSGIRRDSALPYKHPVKEFKDHVEISRQKNIFSQYVAISITDYAGICLKSCPGILQFRSRNNKYCKTSHSELKPLIEKIQYKFSAQGDMYL